MRQFKLNISKDYLFTFITEFTVLIAGIVVYKLAAMYLGDEGFAGYALSRRVLSFLQPVILLGLGVGIPRYVAFSEAGQDKKADTYFISGIIVLIASTIVATGLLLVFRKSLSFVLFGDVKYFILILPMCIMLFGMILHSAVYSYLRGRIKMLIANSIQLINLGIIPLIVFIFNKELIRILIFTGIAWIAISGLFIIVIVAKLHFERNLFRESVRKLLNYGFQRIPGDVGIAAFFLIPAFMTAHIADFTTAGHVAFGVSLLNMVGGAFGPICLILLPQASHFIVKGEMNLLRKTADKILFWTILVTGLGLLIFEIFAESLINLYLGETFHDIILITRLVLLGSFGYTVYISLRSILDAYYIKAVNTKNIFISFVIFCILLIILWLFTDDYIFILLCFVISMLVLGILTLLDTYKIFSQGKLKKGI